MYRTVTHLPKRKIHQLVDIIHLIPCFFNRTNTVMKNQFNCKHDTVQHVILPGQSVLANGYCSVVEKWEQYYLSCERVVFYQGTSCRQPTLFISSSEWITWFILSALYFVEQFGLSQNFPPVKGKNKEAQKQGRQMTFEVVV